VLKPWEPYLEELSDETFNAWGSVPLMDGIFERVSWTIKGDFVYTIE